MISVSDLEKRYGDLRAVSGVTFEIEAGEIVGLLGQNGAGKTTIMKILTGYLEPTRGTATIGGKDVIEERLAVQTQIGYLPENAPLYPEMLVQEYLLMMAELRGIPEYDRRRAVAEAVRSTGLEDRLVQSIGTLSKGFKQRVGLAQAIVHEPKVLILDEPTNGLDPVQILEIRELIQRLAEKTTILLSTHILQEIEAVCDRVIVLIDGHLSTDASLDELLASRVVRLSVAEGTEGVADALNALDDVVAVHEAGVEEGVARYRIGVTEGSRPAKAILAKARELGWEVDEVANERPSLESVFRQLMLDHVARVRGDGSAGEATASDYDPPEDDATEHVDATEEEASA